MCGTDLPGNVYATPAPEDREAMARVVTQGHDALEMTVIEAPVAGATSLSGIQPKLGLVEQGGRYVARTRDSRSSVHIIAKLPANAYPLLPEVEELTLRLARAAGVHTCDAELRPMSDIVAQDQPFTLNPDHRFLAVRRFDRGGASTRSEAAAAGARRRRGGRAARSAATRAAAPRAGAGS